MNVYSDENCPAPAKCVDLYESQENCDKFKSECDVFVDIYKQLSNKYNCSRPQDNSKVPAIWLCDNHSPATEFLFQLKTKEATSFLKTKLFKSTLDGHLSEQYQKLFGKAKSKKK